MEDVEDFIDWLVNLKKIFPNGYITQAQAAIVIGCSRVAIGRLIGQGIIDACWYPNPKEFPRFKGHRYCYVSLQDVIGCKFCK